MMKKILTLLFVASTMLLSAQDKVDLVDPRIGTKGMGHTFPGACYPNGIVQLSPDTDTIPHNIDGVYQKGTYAYCAGYQYDDKTIVGFSHTHLNGTGHSDLGDILFMPTVGDILLNPGTAENPDNGYRSRFSHEREQSRPGFYQVHLDDYNIDVKLTATARTGVHQYSYPKDVKEGNLILDLVHGIYNYDGKVLWANLRVESDTLLTGYRITNGWARVNYTYFAISLSKPIKSYGFTKHDKEPYSGFWRKFNESKNFPEMGGRKVTAYFNFDVTDGEPLEVNCALSAVSTQGAIESLNRETAGKSFADIEKSTKNAWNDIMSGIEVKGEKDATYNLYSSMYHTRINPSIYMDYDGKYRGIDHQIHEAKDFTNYTVFSVWDTFRALHPLYNLLYPSLSKDLIASFMAHQSQSVHKSLPIWSHMGNENWCMIGYHGVSVVADAFAKGIPMNKSEAMIAVDESANVPYLDGLDEYVANGYVPLERSGAAASVTLEYAYDDFAIYQMAKSQGLDEVARKYKERASSYRNLFDKSIGFIRPKHRDGSFKKEFDVLNTHGQGFIEGNSWNYSLYVPHDVIGLIDLVGGDEKFIQRLDSLFTVDLPAKYYANTEDVTKDGLMGNYVHGNEPSHHVPYMYMWTSEPWKTQYYVREVMDNKYKNCIDGLCGNDDCGQMSAWYIFSSMGFYPVCPGTDQYIIGAPYFEYMDIALEGDKRLIIKAPNVSSKNRYVKKVFLNGEEHKDAFFTHKQLINGAEIEFVMSSRPNKSRKFNDKQKPYSLTNDLW